MLGIFILSLLTALAVWAGPIITATKSDALLIDADGDGKADPGDRLGYTVVIANTGDTAATNVVFSDTLDVNTTLVAGTVKASPVAANDTYSALGNVRITFGAGTLSANDFGLPAPAIVVASGNSTQGGTYTVGADGSFSYDPPAGFEGTDSFTYTTSNSAGSDTATVSISVSGMIWFVNNAAGVCTADCDGRLSHPFTSLDAFRAVNNGTGNHPATNDALFVYESATDYSLTGPLTLLSGQRLIGQDATSTLQTLTGLTPPAGSASLPTMASGNGTVARITYPGGTGIALGSNNALYGFTVGATTLGVSGTSFGTLTVRDVTINTTGAGLKLINGTTDAIFNSVTSSGGANNVELSIDGTLALGGGALSGATSNAFLVSGGSGTITYTGAINAAARSVSISSKTGGAVTFGGQVNGTGTGVYLNNNSSATVTFSGGVALSTGANTAFDVSNATVVNVTGANNTLATTTATALNVNNATIGASGLTFRSIASNGGSAPGINLATTGTLGGLTVTGDGGGASNGSGGTIANKSGNGIALFNTRSVALGYMVIQDNQGSGIYGDDVTGFTLTRSTVQRNSNTVDGSEANLRFLDLWGTCALQYSTISDSPYDNIRLTPGSGSLNLTVANSTLGPTPTGGNHGLLIIGSGTADVTLSVNATTFTGNYGSGLLTAFGGSSAQHITVQNSTFTGNATGVDLGHASTAAWNFAVSGSTFVNQQTNAIFVTAADVVGTGRGTINNNIIGNGTAESGAAEQYGIQVSQRGAAHLIVGIANNTIRNTDLEGILVRSGDTVSTDAGSLNLTLSGNNVSAPDDSYSVSPDGIEVRSRQNTSLCANILNNTSAGKNSGSGFNLRKNNTSTFGLQNFTTNVATTLQGNGNTGTVTSEGEPFSGSCTAQTARALPVSNLGLAQFGSALPVASTCIAPHGAGPTSERQSSRIEALSEAPLPVEAPVSEQIDARDVAPEARAGRTIPTAPLTYVSPTSSRQPGLASLLPAGWLRPQRTPGPPINVGPFTLPQGKSITITFEATVDNPMPVGITQVSNQARITGDTFAATLSNDPDTVTANDPTVTHVNITADLRLTQDDSGITAVPGDVIRYALTYTNTGPLWAAGIVITETVPAHTTFDSGASTAGWSCTPNGSAGSTCTYAVGTVLLNASSTVIFAVKVVDPVPAGVTQISNTAAMGSTTFDPTPSDASDSEITPVTAAPDMTLTKNDGGATVAAGGTAVYTLTYTNAGNQNATGVVLTETVPAHTTFNASDSTAGWACTPDTNAGSTCTLAVGALAGGGASGSATFAVTVVNPLPAGVAQLTNTATVADDGSNGADPTPANASGSEATPVNAVPDLTLTKSDGGATVTPGSTLVYTLAYTNTGTQGATGIVLTETVPLNAVFNAGASSVGWTCTPSNNAGSTCTLAVGALAGGGAAGSRAFAVTVVDPVPAGAAQIINSASIGDDGTNGADATTDNSASESTPVNAAPDLVLTKTDNDVRGLPMSTIVYTLTYTNAGDQAATGIVLTETVPANTTFNAGASSAGWACTPNINAGSTCTLSGGSLAGGGAQNTRAFAVTVAYPFPLAESAITNTATITDDGANGADATANNTASDITPIDNPPDLSLSKSDGGQIPAPGDVLSYTLTYTNTGTLAASGTVLTETVPANTTFNDAESTSGWVCTPDSSAGSTCTLDIGTLAAMSHGTAAFAVTVNGPALPAGVTQIHNTAAIAHDGSNGEDFNPGDNTAEVYTTVDAAPDLVLTKSDNALTATPGDTVPYTLTYTNAGTQGATGIVLTETVPANTTFDAASSTTGWVCTPDGSAGSVCALNDGALAGGDHDTAVFAVTVDEPLPTGVTQTTNTATLGDDGSNGADLNPANNTASDTTPLLAAPDLIVTKSDGGISVLPGESITYTLTYTNAGDQGATGVVLTETVPANTTFNAGASTAGWTCTPNANAGSTCTFAISGEVAGDGGTGSVVFVLAVVSPVPARTTSIINSAAVGDDGSNGSDPALSNNQDSETTPLVLKADLEITKSATPAEATVGETVTYVLAYTNHGPEPAIEVVIEDPLPAALTAVQVASSGAAITSVTSIAYTWQVADLMPGEGGRITLTGTLAQGVAPGPFTNTASITTTTVDVAPENNTGTAPVTFVNSAPVADAGVNRTVMVNTEVTLDGSGSSDPDDHTPLTYRWKQSGGPAVTLNGADGATPTFTALPTSTVLTFTLWVTDSYGLAAPTADDVVVTVNDVPVSGLIVTADSPTTIEQATTFTATAGGSNLVYTWNFGDGSPVISGPSPTISHTYPVVGTYTAVVTVTNSWNGQQVSFLVEIQSRALYLPLVQNAHTVAPDLMVERLTATATNVEVVIRNQGNASVEDAFWVDVYLNPTTAPTQVNQTWDSVGNQGLVWGVTGDVLPLAPGESITLTVNDDYYFAEYSSVSWPLALGTPVYAQVDSAGDPAYGGVWERDELSGGVYNNITGPVSSTSTTSQRRINLRWLWDLFRPSPERDLPERP